LNLSNTTDKKYFLLAAFHNTERTGSTEFLSQKHEFILVVWYEGTIQYDFDNKGV
jgi:hypothetical protein